MHTDNDVAFSARKLSLGPLQSTRVDQQHSLVLLDGESTPSYQLRSKSSLLRSRSDSSSDDDDKEGDADSDCAIAERGPSRLATVQEKEEEANRQLTNRELSAKQAAAEKVERWRNSGIVTEPSKPTSSKKREGPRPASRASSRVGSRPSSRPGSKRESLPASGSKREPRPGSRPKPSPLLLAGELSAPELSESVPSQTLEAEPTVQTVQLRSTAGDKAVVSAPQPPGVAPDPTSTVSGGLRHRLHAQPARAQLRSVLLDDLTATFMDEYGQPIGGRQSVFAMFSKAIVQRVEEDCSADAAALARLEWSADHLVNALLRLNSEAADPPVGVEEDARARSDLRNLYPVPNMHFEKVGRMLSKAEGGPTHNARVIHALMLLPPLVLGAVGSATYHGILQSSHQTRTGVLVRVSVMAFYCSFIGAFVSLCDVTKPGGALRALEAVQAQEKSVDRVQVSASVGRRLRLWALFCCVCAVVGSGVIAAIFLPSVVSGSGAQESALHNRVASAIAMLHYWTLLPVFSYWWLTAKVACTLVNIHVHAATEGAQRYKKSGGTPGDHTILIDTWRVRVASPALYLASNTLPMLTKGWGTGLCSCTIGCWIMAVCGMCLLAVEPPQPLLHRSAVLVCSAALALLPLALSVDPASTTTQCGKLLDSINAIGIGDVAPATRQGCNDLLATLSRTNSGHGIGFQVLGRVMIGTNSLLGLAIIACGALLCALLATEAAYRDDGEHCSLTAQQHSTLQAVAGLVDPTCTYSLTLGPTALASHLSGSAASSSWY